MSLHFPLLVSVAACLVSPSGAAYLQASPEPACGGCKSTATDVTTGTTGNKGVSIFIQQTRNGTCREVDEECKQTRGCKVTYNVQLKEGGQPAYGAVKLVSAEVDPDVEKASVSEDDWETDDWENTDPVTGMVEGITKKTSCDKKTFLEASWLGAVASATLECGDCDTQIEPGTLGF